MHINPYYNLPFKQRSIQSLVDTFNADEMSTDFTWEGKINVLSADNYKGVAQTKFLDAPTSRDLRSFKDVRNLSDHRKTAKEKRRLEAQYPDKMLQGIRLLRELVKITRSF